MVGRACMSWGWRVVELGLVAVGDEGKRSKYLCR